MGQTVFPAFALVLSNGTWLELPSEDPEVGATLFVTSQSGPGRFQLAWSTAIFSFDSETITFDSLTRTMDEE